MANEIKDLVCSYNLFNRTEKNFFLIDIWSIKAYKEDIRSYLSKEELFRLEKIESSKGKDLFLLRKGIVRIFLTSFFQTKDKVVSYNYNKYGKPYFSDSYYNDFSFNISHSKEYLFMGIIQNCKLGVDIEKINYRLQNSFVIEDVLTRQEKEIYSCYGEEEKIKAFYKAWVQKEAVSKALGCGLSLGFNDFSVNINPNIADEKYSLDLFGTNFKMRTKIDNSYILATAVNIGTREG